MTPTKLTPKSLFLPCIGIYLIALVFAPPTFGQQAVVKPGARASSPMSGPTIDVWYGPVQTFRKIGVPQRWVNILGNVSDPQGLTSLTCSLNNGSPIDISRGPDSRRLWKTGDFNIDLAASSLNAGLNSLVITAINGLGQTSTSNVTVDYSHEAVWPKSYSTSWGSSTSLQDSAQVVDGKWAVVPGGIAPIETGYDRAIAIGDTTWLDYEVTVKVTPYAIDSTAEAFSPTSGGPGLGFIMRWSGHTGQPAFAPPITQPLSGYLPLGAIGWYHWKTGFGDPGPNQWEILGNGTTDLTLAAENATRPLVMGVTYNFKMQVRTTPGVGGLYKFKVWEDGQVEPTEWLMSAQEALSGPQQGAILLLAQHVSATFGKVEVIPLGQVTTPLLVSPLNNAINQPTTVTLKWDRVGPAAYYGVQVSTDPTFNSNVILDDQSVTDTSRVIGGLSGATWYYWRVNARNQEGTSPYSAPWGFTTNLATPVLSSPPNNSTGEPTNLTFSWTSVPGAAWYRLQVGTDSTFNTGVFFDDPSIVGTSHLVTGLLTGTKYYWRVNARNADGSGLFSTAWNFATALSTPVLRLPLSGATDLASPVLVKWGKVPTATLYRLQVATDSTFSGGFFLDDSSLTDTTKSLTGLLNDRTYYWRVHAKGPAGIGPFSAVWHFSVSLTSPVLVSPVDNAANQPNNLTLRWNKVSTAIAYWLQLSTSSGFGGGFVVNDSTLTDTAKAVAGLADGTRYYWRVAAKNVGGFGAFSGAWSFGTSIAVPVLLSPANNSTGVATTLTLRWTGVSGATTYHLQLGTDSTFAGGIVKDDSTIADTSRLVAGLSGGTKYFWRVLAKTAAGTGAYSVAWNFKCAGQLPAQSVLLVPESLASVSTDTVKFVWQRSFPGVTRYWFELSVDSAFGIRLTDSTLTDTSKTVGPLTRDRTYWWRVKARNAEGWGPFSLVRQFIVKPLSVALTDDGLPQSYSLSQNFPNPFNPSTHIAFSLPKQSHVRLEVYNVLGEVVSTLVDEFRPAGHYTVLFSPSDRNGGASGVYFYRLTADDVSFSRKMLLIK